MSVDFCLTVHRPIGVTSSEVCRLTPQRQEGTWQWERDPSVPAGLFLAAGTNEKFYAALGFDGFDAARYVRGLTELPVSQYVQRIGSFLEGRKYAAHAGRELTPLEVWLFTDGAEGEPPPPLDWRPTEAVPEDFA